MARTPRNPHRSLTVAQASPPADRLRKDIEQQAYALFCQCGYEHGHDLEHWLEAERQVHERSHVIRNAEE